jgi:hypothetical protein
MGQCLSNAVDELGHGHVVRPIAQPVSQERQKPEGEKHSCQETQKKSHIVSS